MSNPILVALDVSKLETARELASDLAPVVGGFKVGSELFTLAGPEAVRQIRALGSQVFLDLKFHDIPNTVSRAVAAAVQLDVQMLTVHTGGGFEMLQAAEQTARTEAKKRGVNPPLVLGVTVLTSFDSNTLSAIGCEANVARQVERLANLALRAELRGLVCSPLEIAALRQFLPTDIQLVTPGIRTSAEAGEDQKRTLTAKEALNAGADWLVVGRPIYQAKNPRAAAEQLVESLS